MTIGIGMLSGGLDSMLSICVIRGQGIQVEAVTFSTPFFSSEKGRKAAQFLGLPLHVLDITEPHLAMIKNPKYGYGRQMNPCIDCHALMFRHAGELMKQRGADFLFSGEVLGQRPMSQNKQSLKIVARLSGFEDFIIRPMSAKLLPPTRPEREGKVDREKLLDIEGRSRKRQLELARHYGITDFPEPAGGCRLTEPNFSKRLRELMAHHQDFSARDIELLKLGRHFRFNEQIKVIVGRNEQENDRMESLRGTNEILLFTEEIPGPRVLISIQGTEIKDRQEVIAFAASLCARYSDAPAESSVMVTICEEHTVRKTAVAACSEEKASKLII
jgi:tRNA U34 2-thiouridine synthase MnmA/TrmU